MNPSAYAIWVYRVMKPDGPVAPFTLMGRPVYVDPSLNSPLGTAGDIIFRLPAVVADFDGITVPSECESCGEPTADLSKAGYSRAMYDGKWMCHISECQMDDVSEEGTA